MSLETSKACPSQALTPVTSCLPDAQGKHQEALWLPQAEEARRWSAPSSSHPSPSLSRWLGLVKLNAARLQLPWLGSSERNVIKIAGVVLHRGGGEVAGDISSASALHFG